MQMIAHDRVGVDRNRKAFAYQTDARLHPVLAMLERLSGIGIDTAKKRPSHAALDAMKGAFCTGNHKLSAGASHT